MSLEPYKTTKMNEVHTLEDDNETLKIVSCITFAVYMFFFKCSSEKEGEKTRLKIRQPRKSQLITRDK